LKVIGPHQTHLGGGGGDFLRALQQLSREIAITVEWVGPVFDENELLRQYRRALLFIYPSLAERGEAMPVAPLEAMANACAPIVSGLECFHDYIEDSVTGFVFNHRSSEPEKHLTTRLLQILRLGQEEIIAMGQRAQAKAAEFEIEKVAVHYLEDFESLRCGQPNEQRERGLALNK
jgi:glycosyltransferase involved in cell wall biosynthesis